MSIKPQTPEQQKVIQKQITPFLARKRPQILSGKFTKKIREKDSFCRIFYMKSENTDTLQDTHILMCVKETFINQEWKTT